MTIRPLAALLIAALLCGISAGSRVATPMGTVTAFHDALARGDRAKAANLLAPGVAIYEAGYVKRSRDEYANHHLSGDIEFARNSTRKVLKQTKRIDGNTAVIQEETETTGVTRGKPLHSLGTELVVFEKQEENWTIVHVHWSSRNAK